MARFSNEIIREIEVGIGISFVEESYSDGEVCFANSSEVRSEFRQSFSARDILNYIRAILFNRKEVETSSLKIPYPKDVFDFWRLVEQDGELKTDVENEGVVC